MRQRLTIDEKNVLTIGLLSFCLWCCSTKKSPTGHWHEFVNDELTHCYKVTDSTYSVDNYTFGGTAELNIVNNDVALWSQSAYDYSTNYKVEDDKIIFNDTIIWNKVTNDEFINDLSMGLQIRIVPKDVDEFDFEYNKTPFRPIIFIGHINDSLTPGKFGIQINDVLATVADIRSFVSWNHQKPDGVILHADKDVPQIMIDRVLCEIYKAWYNEGDIYLTAINRQKQTIGLMRVDKTTANKMFIQCRDSVVRLKVKF